MQEIKLSEIREYENYQIQHTESKILDSFFNVFMDLQGNMMAVYNLFYNETSSRVDVDKLNNAMKVYRNNGFDHQLDFINKRKVYNYLYRSSLMAIAHTLYNFDNMIDDIHTLIPDLPREASIMDKEAMQMVRMFYNKTVKARFDDFMNMINVINEKITYYDEKENVFDSNIEFDFHPYESSFSTLVTAIIKDSFKAYIDYVNNIGEQESIVMFEFYKYISDIHKKIQGSIDEMRMIELTINYFKEKNNLPFYIRYMTICQFIATNNVFKQKEFNDSVRNRFYNLSLSNADVERLYIPKLIPLDKNYNTKKQQIYAVINHNEKIQKQIHKEEKNKEEEDTTAAILDELDFS